ncbi:MAG: bifunctional diaminohydroxyphosphoribosylaminopyrimidine deaminase/5-amino-6-(5-phosphoribosylamino)uracil reductase RibD [Bacteroidota bacterium]
MKQTKEIDKRYLRQCLALASRGSGFVSPNPMVGCVIVKDGRIVGEGYQKIFGGPHAEREALRKAGRQAGGATLYVNLEPCTRRGKTPPCVDAIIRGRIKRVVACSADPNPLVSGRGAKKLRRAGIQVDIGLLRRESERLNERFFMFVRTRLPFVGLKIAQTLDGKVADPRGRSKGIISKQAREEAHRLRSQYDAILVGANTIAFADPQLTVRHIKGRNPLRVVFDPTLRLKPSAAVFNTRKAGTLVFTSACAMSARKSVVARMSRQGVYMLGLDKAKPFDLQVVLRTLAALGVSSVLVEGGPFTAGEFLKRGLVKKVHVFVAHKILGGGINSVMLKASPPLASPITLHDVTCRSVGPDYLIEGSL